MSDIKDLYTELGAVEYNIQLYKAVLEDLEIKKENLLSDIQDKLKESSEASDPPKKPQSTLQ